MELPEHIKEILFTLLTNAMRIIMYILVAIMLVGCTAAMTAPFTLSIWFIFAIIAALSPTYRSPWAAYSGFISVQLLFVALIGFLIAADSNQYPSSTGSGLMLFFGSLFVSWLMWIIWSQDSEEAPETLRWVGDVIKWGVLIGGSILLLRVGQIWYQNTYIW